ncbi:MAG: methylmalonyl-CoA epimerase [Thermoanaerobaculales bacterium]|nr:methylmalonyl-CoA epimerase [Thermoanaerobaculales bacterium]
MGDRPVLDHIGIAVESIAEGRRLYEALGLAVEGEEEVSAQGVRVAFLPVGGGRLELLEPMTPDSPIARHLERRGPGLHHICLRVEDSRRSMADLREQGFELLSEEPQPGAHGCLVAFVHPRSTGGVLLELSQAESADGD